MDKSQAQSNLLHDTITKEIVRAMTALRASLKQDGVHEHVINRALKAAGLNVIDPSSSPAATKSSKSRKPVSSSPPTTRDSPPEITLRSSGRIHESSRATTDTDLRFEVALPHDAIAGHDCVVLAPDGRMFEITIPRTAKPGSILTVNVPVGSIPIRRGDQPVDILHARPTRMKSAADAPPRKRQEQRRRKQDLSVDEILNSDLFGNQYVLDPAGHPLDPETWNAWLREGFRKVRHLFDNHGRVRSEVFDFIVRSPSENERIDQLCAAVPMVWRDIIHEAHDKLGDRLLQPRKTVTMGEPEEGTGVRYKLPDAKEGGSSGEEGNSHRLVPNPLAKAGRGGTRRNT